MRMNSPVSPVSVVLTSPVCVIRLMIVWMVVMRRVVLVMTSRNGPVQMEPVSIRRRNVMESFRFSLYSINTNLLDV